MLNTFCKPSRRIHLATHTDECHLAAWAVRCDELALEASPKDGKDEFRSSSQSSLDKFPQARVPLMCVVPEPNSISEILGQIRLA